MGYYYKAMVCLVLNNVAIYEPCTVRRHGPLSLWGWKDDDDRILP